jgi:hypothetical protein
VPYTPVYAHKMFNELYNQTTSSKQFNFFIKSLKDLELLNHLKSSFGCNRICSPNSVLIDELVPSARYIAFMAFMKINFIFKKVHWN